MFHDYLHVVLTDEDDVPDAMQKLRLIYPNIMKLDYDNRRTRSSSEITMLEAIGQKSEIELYMKQIECPENDPLALDAEKAVFRWRMG